MTTQAPPAVILHTSIPGRCRPKGSFVAQKLPSGKVVMFESGANARPWIAAATKQLKAIWDGRPLIDRPVLVAATFRFQKPKHTKEPYPLSVGDTDKLMRRVLDTLAGTRQKPGPILADDKLVVGFGKVRKLWGDVDGTEVWIAEASEARLL